MGTVCVIENGGRPAGKERLQIRRGHRGNYGMDYGQLLVEVGAFCVDDAVLEAKRLLDFWRHTPNQLDVVDLVRLFAEIIDTLAAGFELCLVKSRGLRRHDEDPE